MYTNGILTVPAFDATETPGEYTITGATYTNQGDNTGQGASAIAVGFVLYVQASDTNTFLPIPGRAHRFKITSVTVVDAATVNLTVLWDELGPIEDAPTNGADCVISSVSDSLKYGFSVDPAVYPTLTAGLVSGMLNSEIQDITDKLGLSGGVISVNGIQGTVTIMAGAGIALSAVGSDILVTSTGDDEGTYQ